MLAKLRIEEVVQKSFLELKYHEPELEKKRIKKIMFKPK